MFHNTVQATGETLDKYRTDAQKQEDRVLAIMQANPAWWTPFAVQEMYGRLYRFVPITSIRRAMTDLTNEGKLEKSDTPNAAGQYGKPNHSWRVIQKQPVQAQLF